MAEKEIGKAFQAPERVIERGRGCWNCIHFENEDLSRQHYEDRIQQEKTAIAMHGFPTVVPIGDDRGSAHDVAHKAAEFMQQGHSMADATNMALAVVGSKDPALQHAVAEARQTDARFAIFNRLSQRGEIGICMKGGSGTDFVHHAYLCDKWSGREGHRIAAEGHAPDKLPEELVEEVDSKAKKA
jgi:hypothetical protein